MIRAGSLKVWSTPAAELHKLEINKLLGIGAWDHVEQSRTCPVEEMQVCSGASNSRIPNVFKGMGRRVRREDKLFRRRPPPTGTGDVSHD